MYMDILDTVAGRNTNRKPSWKIISPNEFNREFAYTYPIPKYFLGKTEYSNTNEFQYS